MLKSNSSLPPQPWNYHVPDSDISIRFSDFGPPLSEIDAAFCLLQAATVTIMHWGQQEPIGPNFLVTKSGDVDLHLLSTDDITWYQWGTAIRGITDFVKRYEAVHMDFDILDAQRLHIAAGVLSLATLSPT